MNATEAAAAAITAWLEDELERRGWNVPDRYAEWFDHTELAAAVVQALEAAGFIGSEPSSH